MTPPVGTELRLTLNTAHALSKAKATHAGALTRSGGGARTSGTFWPDASPTATATAESGCTRVRASRAFSASMRAILSWNMRHRSSSSKPSSCLHVLLAVCRGGTTCRRPPTADWVHRKAQILVLHRRKGATLRMQSRRGRRAHPRGESRASALSDRNNKRYSERDVSMRYGSRRSFVARSSTSVPM